jgi:hypothetical protein
MRLEDYKEAKDKNPDWDKVASRDLKTWTKLYIFDSVLRRTEYKTVTDKISKRIDAFVGLIDDEEIRKRYRTELTEYAEQVYTWTKDHFGKFTPYLLSLALTDPKHLNKQQIHVLEKQGSFVLNFASITNNDPVDRLRISMMKASGYSASTSGDMYYKDVQKLIKQELQNLLDLDVKPTYYANVNPRNIAEMIVRFNEYKRKRQELENRGVELVYVPPHSNCSKRCQKWQGRIYSLNGTSGTVDGKQYIPIEEAADNQTYTSKNTGRTYYNGLFAYNCRHDIQEYHRGMVIEKIPESVMERQRVLEAKQRQMERDYRALREREELYRTIGRLQKSKEVLEAATQTRKKAAALRKEYEAFSRANKIAFYPNRLQVIAGENRYVRTIGKKDSIAQAAKKMKSGA